jgi:hypothetical protein
VLVLAPFRLQMLCQESSKYARCTISSMCENIEEPDGAIRTSMQWMLP